MSPNRVSVIIPCLNEGAVIGSLLKSLQPCRRQGHEVILVDGGSDDGSAEISASLADRLIVSPKGRARQMNVGARAATREFLWFLHADSGIDASMIGEISRILGEGRHCWGRFDVRLSGDGGALRMVEFMMNWRSRLTGIATGDQGIFVTRHAFESVGGYPDIPLMEDVAISRALKRLSRPATQNSRILTSSRRWEKNGTLKTILLMWRLRFAYALGADPARLSEKYRSCGSPETES